MDEMEIMKTLHALSKKHLELNEEIKNLQYKDDGIKAQIKTICESEGIQKFDDGEYFVSIVTTTQNRLDKTLVEKYLTPEVIKECYKESVPFSVIRWKKKEDEEQ